MQERELTDEIEVQANELSEGSVVENDSGEEVPIPIDQLLKSMENPKWQIRKSAFATLAAHLGGDIEVLPQELLDSFINRVPLFVAEKNAAVLDEALTALGNFLLSVKPSPFALQSSLSSILSRQFLKKHEEKVHNILIEFSLLDPNLTFSAILKKIESDNSSTLPHTLSYCSYLLTNECPVTPSIAKSLLNKLKTLLSNPMFKIKQLTIPLIGLLCRYFRDDQWVLEHEICNDLKEAQVGLVKTEIQDSRSKIYPEAFILFEGRDPREQTSEPSKFAETPEFIAEIPFLKKFNEKKEALQRLCTHITNEANLPIEPTIKTLIALLEDANYLLFAPSLGALQTLLTKSGTSVSPSIVRKVTAAALPKFNSKQALNEDVLQLISTCFLMDPDYEGFLRTMIGEIKFGKGAARLCCLEWISKKLPSLASHKMNKSLKLDQEPFCNTLISLLSGKFDQMIDQSSTLFLICAFVYDQLNKQQREKQSTRAQNEIINCMAVLTQSFLAEIEQPTTVVRPSSKTVKVPKTESKTVNQRENSPPPIKKPKPASVEKEPPASIPPVQVVLEEEVSPPLLPSQKVINMLQAASSAADIDNIADQIRGLSFPFSKLSSSLEKALKNLPTSQLPVETALIELIPILFESVIPNDREKLAVLLLALLGKGKAHPSSLSKEVIKQFSKPGRVCRLAFAVVYKNFSEPEQQTFISRICIALINSQTDPAVLTSMAPILIRGLAFPETAHFANSKLEFLKEQLGVDRLMKTFEKELVSSSKLYESFVELSSKWVTKESIKQEDLKSDSESPEPIAPAEEKPDTTREVLDQAIQNNTSRVKTPSAVLDKKLSQYFGLAEQRMNQMPKFPEIELSDKKIRPQLASPDRLEVVTSGIITHNREFGTFASPNISKVSKTVNGISKILWQASEVTRDTQILKKEDSTQTESNKKSQTSQTDPRVDESSEKIFELEQRCKNYEILISDFKSTQKQKPLTRQLTPQEKLRIDFRLTEAFLNSSTDFTNKIHQLRNFFDNIEESNLERSLFDLRFYLLDNGMAKYFLPAGFKGLLLFILDILVKQSNKGESDAANMAQSIIDLLLKTNQAGETCIILIQCIRESMIALAGEQVEEISIRIRLLLKCFNKIADSICQNEGFLDSDVKFKFTFQTLSEILFIFLENNLEQLQDENENLAIYDEIFKELKKVIDTVVLVDFSAAGKFIKVFDVNHSDHFLYIYIKHVYTKNLTN